MRSILKLLLIRYYVKILCVFNHPSLSRSFLIVNIHPPRFQSILPQRFQPPILKQNQPRIIRRHLTLNQASQEISLHIPPRKSQERIIWYIYPLIATLLILPTTVILFRLIIRFWKSRLGAIAQYPAQPFTCVGVL